jgi:hypothetical protein
MMAGANLTPNIRVPDASQAGFNRPLNIVIDTNALLMKRLQCSALRETGQKGTKRPLIGQDFRFSPSCFENIALHQASLSEPLRQKRMAIPKPILSRASQNRAPSYNNQRAQMSNFLSSRLQKSKKNRSSFALIHIGLPSWSLWILDVQTRFVSLPVPELRRLSFHTLF